jgi:hypothetical protein
VPHVADDDDSLARAMVRDASGYAGGLVTHPEFFCAHFEARR